MKQKRQSFFFSIWEKNQEINKIIFTMNYIDKDSMGPFEGWKSQNDINEDQLILSNILKRKSTMSTLPPLNNLKIRNSSHQQIHSQLKLEPPRTKHLLKKYQNNIEKRQQTEEFNDYYRDSISPLKRKLVQILNEEQTQNTPQPIIQQSINQNKSQVTIHKTHQHQQQSYYIKYKLSRKNKELKPAEFLLKQKNNADYGNMMKKTQSKMYMKLNALEIINDFKKNIYKDAASIHNLTSKNRLTQSSTQTSKTKTHKRIIPKKEQIEQKLEKVNEKLKQTFFKCDVFSKKKQKKQKLQKLDLLAQFNDQMIFSNSPNRMGDKQLTRRITPLKTIQKERSSRQDLSIPVKIRVQKSPHRYKHTIN